MEKWNWFCREYVIFILCLLHPKKRKARVRKHIKGVLFAFPGISQTNVQASDRVTGGLHNSWDPPFATEQFNEGVGLKYINLWMIFGFNLKTLDTTVYWLFH